MKYGDFWWISLEKGPITLAPTWFFMFWLFRIYHISIYINALLALMLFLLFIGSCRQQRQHQGGKDETGESRSSESPASEEVAQRSIMEGVSFNGCFTPNGWFIMENPIKMDGTPIFGNIHLGVSFNGGSPQMDGENNGKPYFLMDDFGVPLFSETSIGVFPVNGFFPHFTPQNGSVF